jgi:KDO2-lipid IV(A) lauroyltransferase
VVRSLPRPLAWAVFAAGADRATARRGRGIRRLAANLRRVVGPDLPEPEFQALVRAATRSYARYWLDAFRLPSRSMEHLREDIHIEGADLLAAAIAEGRGVVAALPHSGNWDAAGAWVAANGWPMVTVAERLASEELYERFLAFRRELGMEILPHSGGPQPVLETLAERLKAGAVVALVADRDLSARGVEVTFFGAPARMPAGPALLALRTGAPLFAVSLWYEPDGARGKLVGPIEPPGAEEGPLDVRVRLLTQRLADRFAEGIAEHPQDWHMMQRVWPDMTDAG